MGIKLLQSEVLFLNKKLDEKSYKTLNVNLSNRVIDANKAVQILSFLKVNFNNDGNWMDVEAEHAYKRLSTLVNSKLKESVNNGQSNDVGANGVILDQLILLNAVDNDSSSSSGPSYCGGSSNGAGGGGSGGY